MASRSRSKELFVAGAAVEWRRTAAWGAAALTAYYALIVVILMNGRVVLAHYAEFGTYSGVAEQLAITAGGLIVYAWSVKIARLAAILLTAMYASFTPTGARADAPRRSLQPYELDRERHQSRPDRRRLGGGGLAQNPTQPVW